MLRKIITIVMCIVFVFTSVMTFNSDVEAKATKKALKFLKGTWVSCGHGQDTKAIFTKKYMKLYNLNYEKGGELKVKSPKKKGKYIGKWKIIYTKKKGKRWIIKVGKKGDYTIYKSHGKNVLDCHYKWNGEWMYSGSSSYERFSKKIYK